MSIPQIEIQLIASIIAIACALPGVFLVLRKIALMSDALSHAILLGIVLGFFLVKDLSSPLLIIGAALIGLLLVSSVELLSKTRLVPQDAAIGLIFPALFSLAVLLISRYAGNVHLDTDAVLLGELAFAPFNRLTLFGLDFGPRALYSGSGILLLNLLFIFLFYKELKLATFDEGLSATLGFSPDLIHYSFMAIVSITAVGAFDSVGSILVVALMIAPPASAYLLTDSLRKMLLLSALFGLIGAVCGYWAAHFFDVNIAGSIATFCGGIFAVVYIAAPERGIIAGIIRKKRQHFEISITMLLVHLLHHEGTELENIECKVPELPTHLNWQSPIMFHIIQSAIERNLITKHRSLLKLTDRGRERARNAMIK
ncbi:metal ABC transporter permease [bacterium]|nr:metal ABC transporter permease [bacterium]MCP5462020.1 metal ABC transporter permease [bacterium]